MNNELKPCPFCGGEAEVYSYEAERDIFDPHSLGYVDTEYYDVWGCWCKTCDAMIPEKRTEVKAVEAWNRRANEKPESDPFEYEDDWSIEHGY